MSSKRPGRIPRSSLPPPARLGLDHSHHTQSGSRHQRPNIETAELGQPLAWAQAPGTIICKPRKRISMGTAAEGLPKLAWKTSIGPETDHGEGTGLPGGQPWFHPQFHRILRALPILVPSSGLRVTPDSVFKAHSWLCANSWLVFRTHSFALRDRS